MSVAVAVLGRYAKLAAWPAAATVSAALVVLLGYRFQMLAQAVLGALRTRGELGWHTGRVPALDPGHIATELGMDRDRWLVVCDWGRMFYQRVAGYRFDPSKYLADTARFDESRRRIAAGKPPACSALIDWASVRFPRWTPACR
jgi:hypothetical protein